MNRLTRDGTAVPVSRGQILRLEREQGKLKIKNDHDARCSDIYTVNVLQHIHCLTTFKTSVSHRMPAVPIMIGVRKKRRTTIGPW